MALLALYIIAMPFVPRLEWWIRQRHYKPSPSYVQVTPKSVPATPVPETNQLVIPRIDLTQTINTGPSQYELSKGVWLIPQTSTPDKGSNTVMAGHRFTYAGPAVFYFLDKVQTNDRIVVDWQHKEYTYRVASIQAVTPTDLAVQKPSQKSELTLFTCTPLWTSKQRLVIVSDLVGVRS